MPRITLLCLALFLLLTGCVSIGPDALERDRFDYSTAVAESWKRMMLLNIVKVRYGDTPIFLEVGSIVNQYSLEQEMSAGANLRSGGLFGDGLSLGGNGIYTDKPTVTYSPLTGKKFTKSLLTPIPPYALFSLIQSGWNVKFLMKVCLSSINGLNNSSRRYPINRAADQKFEALIDNLSYIQQSGGLGSRLLSRESEQTILFFRSSQEPELRKRVNAVIDLLGLDSGKQEFRLVYGSAAANGQEIAMLTRSMLDITAELAQYIEVPRTHILENRASEDFRSDAGGGSNQAAVAIRSSLSEPQDAFLTIKYRDHWFYIEDTDFKSKRLFSFLLFLFTIAEGGIQSPSPVLTVPAG